MSLKENLENFLENYENMTDLSSSLDGSDSFEMEFTHLKQISQRYRMDKVYPTTSGESEVNMRKNRYKDILPFDHSRFILSAVDGQEGSDYINANYLKGISYDHAYLAAQGPLPHTVNDFWRMLWESNAQIIIMACNEFEQGRHKCERYWVDEGEEHSFGDILVTQIRQQRVTKDFMIRTLKATKDKEEKIFNQFHYTAWPDHGVPTSVRPILEMIKLVREYQKDEDPPIVVHCSAGCGRTGTICVIDYVRNALAQEKIDQNFSLYDIILEMRKQRHAIVQTRNQYELVHRAVVTMFQNKLGIKPESKDDFGHNYENVQLRHEHFDQPRMPPKVPSQGGSGDKRDSQSHSYVNCNITSKGVSIEPEPPMPKLPSTPLKPSRSADSPDGSTYANYHVGGTPNEGSGQDAPSPSGKQGLPAKPRQSPDVRYQNNFKATLSAFKDIESDCSSPAAVVPPSSITALGQPQALPRVKPTQAPKPVTGAKPLIAEKPGKFPKPSPKLASVDGGSKTAAERSVSVDAVMQSTNLTVKASATRQDSSQAARVAGKEASPLPARNSEKKDTLKLPVKPTRQMSKSDSVESPLSPGVRQGLPKTGLKATKSDRPTHPPPRPPPNIKPNLARSNGEDRSSYKGHHEYELVSINLPPEKIKENSEVPNDKNVRASPGQQMDSLNGKENNIVRRKTDTHRKLSSGSVQSGNNLDVKMTRKSSDSTEYAYVSQPQSRVEQLLKEEEENAAKIPSSALYATAYAESSPNPALGSSGSVKDYSYVDSPKLTPPEKPRRGESHSESDGESMYDLVSFPGNDSTGDSFASHDISYSCVGPMGGVGDLPDDRDEVPVVPAKTSLSYQLVDDEEKISSGGKFSQLKAKINPPHSKLPVQLNLFKRKPKTKQKTELKSESSPDKHQFHSSKKKSDLAALKESGGSSHSNAPSSETDGAKHSNINELLEKTLKDYQPVYKESPVVYKEQDIGFPKRVAGPRRPRSPPRSWTVRSSDGRSAQVHL